MVKSGKPNWGQQRRTFLWAATFVLLVAALMRLVLLQDVPPGLSQDEVLNADIASYIRQGRNALFFREGYGHEPLYHYWSVPFQILFGDNFLGIRLPAVYLGLLLVAVTMRWVRRDFGSLSAIVTGIGLSISWWPVIFSRVGLRPVLEPLLLVLAVLFWPRRPWLAGLLLGLTVYSYSAARYSFLIPLLMAIYLLLFHPTSREDFPRGTPSFANLRSSLVILVISLTLFIPLALTLRDDPTLQQRIGQLSAPLDALVQGDAGPVVEMTIATLGVFSFTGDPRWTYMVPGQPIFEPVTALLFYIGLGLAIWRWRQPLYALVLIWFLFALLPSAVTPDAPSTIRLVGAMPLVYLMPGLAVAFLLAALFRKREKWSIESGKLRKLTVLFAVVIMAIFLWRTIGDGFVRWTRAWETRLKYQTVSLEMSRYWKENPEPRLVIADAFFEPIDADSFRRNLGSEPDARWVQTGDSVAGAVVIPGDEGDGRFYVPEYAPPSAILLEAAEISAVPNYRSYSEPSFAVYELPDMLPLPAESVAVTLDEVVTFTGYTLLDSVQGQPLQLVTFWLTEKELPADLAIFAHLLAEDGAIVSQHDGLDATPLTLRPGDLIIQRHVLELPEVLPAEPLILQVGMYQRTDGRRLLHDGFPSDRIILLSDLSL